MKKRKCYHTDPPRVEPTGECLHCARLDRDELTTRVKAALYYLSEDVQDLASAERVLKTGKPLPTRS